MEALNVKVSLCPGEWWRLRQLQTQAQCMDLARESEVAIEFRREACREDPSMPAPQTTPAHHGIEDPDAVRKAWKDPARTQTELPSSLAFFVPGHIGHWNKRGGKLL